MTIKQCKNCGADLPEEANLCLDCLTIQAENTDMAVPVVKNTSKIKKIIIPAVIAVIAVIVFTVALSYGLTKPNQPLTNDSSSDIPVLTEDDTNDDLNVLPEITDNETTTNASEGIINVLENRFNPDKSVNSTIYNADNGSVTNKPTNPNNQTEATNPPVQEKPTDKGENATNGGNTGGEESTTAPETEIEYDKFEYYFDSSNYLHISKYIGNKKHVIIPDKINGFNVRRIDSRAFEDNSTVETVTFKKSEEYHSLTVDSFAFQNCSSLKTINFGENTDWGIFERFASNCQKLSNINIDHWQYKVYDHALYYYNTQRWSLVYIFEGYNTEEYHEPDFISTFQSYFFDYNIHIKRIYLNDKGDIYGLHSSYLLNSNPNLEGIYVSKNNQNSFDVDGVLFGYKGGTGYSYNLQFYPQNKKDKSFTIPNYSRFRDFKNAYIEELVIPKNVVFIEKELNNICLNKGVPNLKTIKIENGSPYINQVKSAFTGKVIVY